jgi:eukaryotic-like serine/threonine-protein kinase
MNRERHGQITELFDQVADEPPSERRRLLEAACGEDRGLATEVLELFEAEARSNGILNKDVATLAGELLDEEEIGAPTPWRFGRYAIHEYLGEGGMGAVYLAERDGLGDRVAVKFLRDPWNSPERRENFAREQRTLAGLTHPYIARLYDAGDANGTPWFAMEYVRGVSITEYAKTSGLGLRGRLELFRAACSAVSYAHRNLIVHLDLKPSNILVNADGDVKLLDFGIARDLASGDAGMAQRLLSLNYAAPEQIRGAPADVQMDVYALGAVLYELITDAVPVDLARAEPGDVPSLMEKRPRPPSVAARENLPPMIAASRAEWRDLDVLCLSAIERERSLRYQSVDALIRDVDHFLKEEPLDAHPAHFRYRTAKFLRRNRRAVAAGTAGFLCLAAVVAFFMIRLVSTRDRAVASEARTERIHRFLINLFDDDTSGPGASSGSSVVSLVDRGARQTASLSKEPDLQGELRSTFGDLYHRLGYLDRAEPLLLEAWEARKSHPDDPATMKAELAFADLRVDQSRFDEAERMARESLERARRRYSDSSVEAARAKYVLGKAFAEKGDYKAAVPLLEDAVRGLPGNSAGLELSNALGELANTEYYLEHLQEAEAINLRALNFDRKLFGEAHPSTGIDLFNLGAIQLDRANYADAERFFRQALKIDEAWYGEVHPKTASALLMVGRAAAYQNRLSEAAALYERAANAMRATYGSRNPRYGQVLSLMGDLAVRRHDLAAAETLFRQAADVFKTSVGEHHEFYLHQFSNLGSVRLAAGQYKDAELLLRPALGELKTVAPNGRYTAFAEVRLGAALAGEKRYGEAEAQAADGYTKLVALMGPGAVEVSDARRVLDEIHAGLRQRPKSAL